MKNFITLVIINVTSIFTMSLVAQDATNDKINELTEVVVVASKFPVKIENTGRSVVNIDQSTLEKLPFQTVASLLTQITGIEINGSQNAAGKNLGYYVRGGRSHQLLILIDGIPVTDASGINFSYDLNLLSIHQIEHIEIMKGAASTLYGSGAAVGVINIKTKEAKNNEISGSILLSAGTNNSEVSKNYKLTNHSQSFDIKASKDKTKYYLSFSNLVTDGMSEGLKDQTEPLESDSFQQLNILAKIKHAFTENFSTLVIGSYRKINHDYDFAFMDSDVNTYENTEKLISIQPEYRYEKGSIAGTVSYKSLIRNDVSEYGLSNFKSESLTADVFNTHQLSSSFTLVSGVDFQYQAANFNTSYEVLAKNIANFYMVDPYVNAVLQSNSGFNLNFGGRLNIHEQYGTNWVYNLNPSFLIKTTVGDVNLMASLSTAFITPSLYQLYSSYGKSDLNPEESKNYEIGYTLKTVKNKITFTQQYFFREETNSIGFYTDYTTWISNYYNQEGTQFFRGVEHDLKVKLSDNIKFSINHTYTHLNLDESFLIPKVKWNSNIYYSNSKLGNFTLNYSYKGKRSAQNFQNFPATIETLKSFQLLDVGYNKAILNDKLNIYLNLTNLLNEKFVENLGYVTKATNINVALKYSF